MTNATKDRYKNLTPSHDFRLGNIFERALPAKFDEAYFY
jgi:hypothetical protein